MLEAFGLDSFLILTMNGLKMMSLSLSLKSLYWLPLDMAALIVCLASLAGFGGKLWWRFDLFSHFRVQYLVSLSIASLLFLVGRRYTAAALTGVFAVINLALILPLYIGSPLFLKATYGAAAPLLHSPPATYREQSAVSEDRIFRLLLCNVLQTNRQYSLLGQEIQQTRPDLVLVVEVDQPWIDGLQPYLLDYPYAALHARRDTYGIAVFSRFPLTSEEVLYFGDAHLPSVQVSLDLNDRPLTLIGTHPPPPRGPVNSSYRNQQMTEIAQYISGIQGARILAGDLNVTSWSPFFKEWLGESGLHDSRLGFGVQATWPTTNPVFLIPLDHVLVSPDIQVIQRQVGANVGSDHHPVLMDFTLKGRQ